MFSRKQEIDEIDNSGMSQTEQLQLLGNWLKSICPPEYQLTYKVTDEVERGKSYYRPPALDLIFGNTEILPAGDAQRIHQDISKITKLLNAKLKEAYSGGSSKKEEIFKVRQLVQRTKQGAPKIAEIGAHKLTLFHFIHMSAVDDNHAFGTMLALAHYYSKRELAATAVVQGSVSMPKVSSSAASQSSSSEVAVVASAEMSSPIMQQSSQPQTHIDEARVPQMVAVKKQPVVVQDSPLIKKAKMLAKFISDHRQGDSNAPKQVHSHKEIKKKMEEAIAALQQQSEDKKAIPFQLLNAIYETIYEAGEDSKNNYFKRQNDNYAHSYLFPSKVVNYFSSFFEANTYGSKLPRSGTERDHMTLLQNIFLNHMKTLASDPAANNSAILTEALTKYSKLLQLDMSTYYKKDAKEGTKTDAYVEAVMIAGSAPQRRLI